MVKFVGAFQISGSRSDCEGDGGNVQTTVSRSSCHNWTILTVNVLCAFGFRHDVALCGRTTVISWNVNRGSGALTSSAGKATDLIGRPARHQRDRRSTPVDSQRTRTTARCTAAAASSGLDRRDFELPACRETCPSHSSDIIDVSLSALDGSPDLSGNKTSHFGRSARRSFRSAPITLPRVRILSSLGKTSGHATSSTARIASS